MTEAFSALHEDDHQKIDAIVKKLHTELSARITAFIDRDGRQIAVHGDTRNLDMVSLACLVAGNVAATDELARLLGEKEFSVLFHEGEHDNIHISVVSRLAILIIIFDNRSSLGLVRLRVKKTLVELAAIISELHKKQEVRTDLYKTPVESPFEEVTDDDIARLFRKL